MELKNLKEEVLKLNRMISPLMAITDITIRKKTTGDSGSFSQGIPTHQNITQEERLRELEMCNPQIVLTNLVEHIFNADLSPAMLR